MNAPQEPTRFSRSWEITAADLAIEMPLLIADRDADG